MTVHSTTPSTIQAQITLLNHDDSPLAIITGPLNQAFTFSVPDPELWSPETPTLYDVIVQVGQDTVRTYLGFRSVARQVINGVMRPTLNGEFVFPIGLLECVVLDLGTTRRS